MYNEQLAYAENEAENNENVLIIRPSVDLGVKRMEKDLYKVKAMYELGRKDALDSLNRLKEFWK